MCFKIWCMWGWTLNYNLKSDSLIFWLWWGVDQKNHFACLCCINNATWRLVSHICVVAACTRRSLLTDKQLCLLVFKEGEWIFREGQLFHQGPFTAWNHKTEDINNWSKQLIAFLSLFFAGCSSLAEKAAQDAVKCTRLLFRTFLTKRRLIKTLQSFMHLLVQLLFSTGSCKKDALLFVQQFQIVI